MITPLSGELVRCLTLDQQVLGIELSHDGLRLATTNGRVYFVWSAQHFRLLAQLNRGSSVVHRKCLRFCRFSLNDECIITFGSDHRIAVWNVQERSVLHVMQGHRDKILSATLSSDGQSLLTCSADGTVAEWDWQKGELLHNFVEERTAIRSLDVALSFPRLAVALADGCVSIWDMNNHARMCEIRADEVWMKSGEVATRAGAIDNERSHTGPLTDVKFSPDGTVIATCSDDGTCKIWSALSLRRDLSTMRTQKQVIQRPSAHVGLREQRSDSVNGNETPLSLGFHASLLHTFCHEAACTQALFTHDSAFVVTVSHDATCKIWQLAPNTPADGELAFQVNLPHAPTDVVLSKGWREDPDDSISSYRLLVAIQQRVVVLDLSPSSATSTHPIRSPQQILKRTTHRPNQQWPPSTSITAGRYSTLERVLNFGLTREILQECIAHGNLHSGEVLSALMAHSGCSKPAVIKGNLKTNHLEPNDLLRVISSTKGFRLDDILSAASMTGELGKGFFHSISQGLSTDRYLLEMGFEIQSVPETVLMKLTPTQANACFSNCERKATAVLPLNFESSLNSSPTQGKVQRGSQASRAKKQSFEGMSRSDGKMEALGRSSDLGLHLQKLVWKPEQSLPERNERKLLESGRCKIGGTISGFYSPRGICAQGVLRQSFIHDASKRQKPKMSSKRIQRKSESLKRDTHDQDADGSSFVDADALDAEANLESRRTLRTLSPQVPPPSKSLFLLSRVKPPRQAVKPLFIQKEAAVLAPPDSKRSVGAYSTDIRNRLKLPQARTISSNEKRSVPLMSFNKSPEHPVQSARDLECFKEPLHRFSPSSRHGTVLQPILVGSARQKYNITKKTASGNM